MRKCGATEYETYQASAVVDAVFRSVDSLCLNLVFNINPHDASSGLLGYLKSNRCLFFSVKFPHLVTVFPCMRMTDGTDCSRRSYALLAGLQAALFDCRVKNRLLRTPKPDMLYCF